MADWNAAAVLDHSKFKDMPGYIRGLYDLVENRLTAYLYGFTTGETLTGFKKARLLTIGTGAGGATPGTGAATAYDLYSRANGTSAAVELWGIDASGNEIQLTKSGKIPLASIATGGVSDAFIASLLKLVYPIGCIYTEYSGTNPATTFGFGTWSLFGAGKVIVCVDSTDTDFDAPGDTFGEKTHTLTTAELAAHTHSISAGFAGAITTDYTHLASMNREDGTNTSGSAGSGTAHNNVQPSIAAYVWRRTA